jgi:hypothetical protein
VSGKCRRNKFYPKAIKNRLRAKLQAFMKIKYTSNQQGKACYVSIANACASLIFNYDRDRQQMIVDSRNLVRFYQYISGKLSCKTGVG